MGKSKKLDALATVDKGDQLQTLVEVAWLRQDTPSQIASQLQIPILEAKQRLRLVQDKFAEQKASPEWIRNQQFELIRRSRERYVSLEKLLKDKFDPFLAIRGMRDEDKHLAFLIDNVGAVETPEPISTLKMTEETVTTEGGANSLLGKIMQQVGEAHKNWDTADGLTMSRRSIEIATRSEALSYDDDEEGDEDED